MHPVGPSACLPSSSTLTSLHCPTNSKLVGCASDRKDFYHQAKVSRARAHSNILPFEFDARQWRSSKAFSELVEEVGRPYDRLTGEA
jgi:hypothetical protein